MLSDGQQLTKRIRLSSSSSTRSVFVKYNLTQKCICCGGREGEHFHSPSCCGPHRPRKQAVPFEHHDHVAALSQPHHRLRSPLVTLICLRFFRPADDGVLLSLWQRQLLKTWTCVATPLGLPVGPVQPHTHSGRNKPLSSHFSCAMVVFVSTGAEVLLVGRRLSHTANSA